MKEHKDFVVAVIIAMCIPISFGVIYLYKMETNQGSNEFIAKLEDRKELFIFGNRDLENIKDVPLADSNYKDGTYQDFEIYYASGSDKEVIYTIKIRDIYLGTRVDGKSLTWRLEQQGENGDYTQLANGNFDTTNGEIDAANFLISLNDSQHFRIYYYFNKEVVDKRFFAKITVE